MLIPPILFKYQAFTPDALSNLACRQVWFSRPSKFNDPFDCAIRIDRGPIPDSDYQRLYEFGRQESSNTAEFEAIYSPSAAKNLVFRKDVQAGLVAEFEKQKLAMRNERGVCCFSACNDNILMWSHYADSHNGFCLGFKTDSEPFSEALRVKYKCDVPAVNPIPFVLDDDENAFLAMILTKSRCWRYEEEWRLFHMEADTAYGYAAGTLESVYFGMLMPECQQLVIGKLLDGTGIKFYRMERDPVQFSVRANPVIFTATA